MFDFSTFPTLTIERLILRHVVPDDAADVFVFRSDPEVQKYNAEPIKDVAEVDISAEQIRLARQNVAQGTFIQGDMMGLDFPPADFDTVVAFYSIFHLPREEHRELFRRIHHWLKPGGYLLATVAWVNEAAYTEDDFCGVTMYWSNYGLDEYKTMLTQIGFTLLEATTVGHGYAEGQQPPAEMHPLIFAQAA